MKNFIIGGIIAGFIFSAGTMTYANNIYNRHIAIPETEEQLSPEAMKTQFDGLVKSGTISQDQADKITAYLQQKYSAKMAELKKLEGMSEEQKKAYIESLKEKGISDPLKDLVNQKIISEAQADAIRKAMPTHERLEQNDDMSDSSDID